MGRKDKCRNYVDRCSSTFLLKNEYFECHCCVNYFQIVERRGNEFQQAKALKLLFSLKQQSSYHAREFKAMNGYALLAKVLTSDRAVISMDLLKVCF